MSIRFPAAGFLLLAFPALAQLAPPDTVRLDTVVVAAGRLPERKTDAAQPVAVITAAQIGFWNAQTSADVLQQTGQVFVQRSQMGGGSPVLRGFEANRVLIVVDGVRMNNAIYRSGHLQNVITLDPNIQGRVEVLFGAGSVLYGSDALGGVLHFQTQDAVFAAGTKPLVTARATTRLATANTEKTLHADVNVGLRKWAFLSSLTASDFDDLRAGRRDNPFRAYQWRRPLYATRLENRDTALANSKPQLQVGSAYRQLDMLQKIAFRPTARSLHLLSLHYSTSSDIPRYDRLSETSADGRPVFAQWHYGPQTRLLGTYGWHTTRPRKAYDELRLIASYQRIGESRYSRRFGSDFRTARLEELDIYGFNADLQKKTGPNAEWSYGAEWYHNRVRSVAGRTHIGTGQTGYTTSRYPDGGSRMNLAGLYGRLKWRIGKRLLLIPAMRLSYVTLLANSRDPLFGSYFKTLRQANTAFNGQLGGVYTLPHGWRFTAAVSTGFRAPNVDDLGKTFESAGGAALIMPSPGLGPEYTLTAETGLDKTIGGRVRIETNVFHTWMRDAIRLVPARFNGRDTVLFDGQPTRVYQNANTGRARVRGVYAGAEVLLHRLVSASASITCTAGRDVSQAAPLDHIPPAYGRLALRGHSTSNRLSAEFSVLYNAWKRLRAYSPSGEDNLLYAIPAEGTPAWYTLNLRGSYRLGRWLHVQAAVENLADTHYRMFASGISAPGRNVVLALRGSF